MATLSQRSMSKCYGPLHWNQEWSLQRRTILYQHEKQTNNSSLLSRKYVIRKMKTKVEAAGYRLMMCSALCQDGLNEIFNESIRLTMRKRFDGRIKRKQEEKMCQLIWYWYSIFYSNDKRTRDNTITYYFFSQRDDIS